MNTLITLPNGSTAVDFTPQDSKEKAIVHLSVIQRLARLLPKADPVDILEAHIQELQKIQYETKKQDMLKEAVSATAEFVAFHVTVNLIQAFVPEGEMPDNMPKIVGKIRLDEREEGMR